MVKRAPQIRSTQFDNRHYPFATSRVVIRRSSRADPSIATRCVYLTDGADSELILQRTQRLNHIEEGSYGIVFRARCKTTGAIVALKKLKMDKEKNGFPITSLREIQTLMVANHENIVRVREIVVGDTLTQYVSIPVPRSSPTDECRRVFIVMDFIEHDLKSLLANMPTPFLASEIKTLLLQLLSAIALCHDNWIVHRDLKTSNLLMNNRGQIKVADFGLARTFGDPLGDMTQLVVTLWYRCVDRNRFATQF